jgi:hypothetical protein
MLECLVAWLCQLNPMTSPLNQLAFAITLALICTHSDAQTTRPSADTSKAWLLHLPGISGETGLDRGMLAGLRQGGYDGKIEVYDWTGRHPGLGALLANKHNHEEAQKIADRITKQFHDQPDGQILIVSHSAGTGLCVWALEDLANDVKVDTVFLLSPALSPNYDLSKALSHVKGKAYAFFSPNDFLVLAAGTHLFGTIDGKKTAAAGNTGFTRPDGADAKQYDKLVAEPYDPAWMKLGNIGDHVGYMMPVFDAAVLAPLMLGSLPRVAANPTDGDRVGHVKQGQGQVDQGYQWSRQ